MVINTLSPVTAVQKQAHGCVLILGDRSNIQMATAPKESGSSLSRCQLLVALLTGAGPLPHRCWSSDCLDVAQTATAAVT